MRWSDYLAILSWQGCKICLKDFINLESQDIQSPENFADIVSLLETKEYLMSHKYWWKKAEKDYKHCQEKNYHLIYPGKKSYPKKILNFFDNVPIFLVQGEWPLEEDFLPVTIVGSRQADEQALNWMDFYLPSVIKEKKICILSGGARGIDQKAHSIAIRSQTPTLCFLPSGLDCFYPKQLKSFQKGILDSGGAFISCFPPWEEMRKPYFHIRNSFMSACSRFVLVVQAERRSGTMLTAGKSLEYGIPVAVLPGPVLSARWTGNLQLIYDGAYMIRDNMDLSVLIESLAVSCFEWEKETSLPSDL